MRDKIYLAVISGIFLCVLIWCPFMLVLHKSGAVFIEDNRNYIDPKIYEDGLLSGILNRIEEGKTILENMYINYLPAYDQIVQVMRDTETNWQMDFVDMLALYFRHEPENINIAENTGETETESEETVREEILPQFTVTYIGEDAFRTFYAIRPYDFLESVMKPDEETLYRTMRRQAEGINRLIAANTDVNFYVYISGTMQDEEYFRHIMPNELCTAPMFQEFMDSIEGAAGIDRFKIPTLADKLKKQWRTDHHWNSAGSYDVYRDIIRMISRNSPEIGEPVEILEIKEYPEIQFRGSYAALAGYRRFYDDFFVYVYDLPDSPSPALAMRSREREYDEGRHDANSNIFADHYVNYYHIKNRYAYNNNTGRNLMLIGDSMTYWSAWLIAANFDSTYIYMPWDRQYIDYNQYIYDNGITDVLLMVHSQAGIFDIYGYSTYGQLQTGDLLR
jgi:hypothetical protein